MQSSKEKKMNKRQTEMIRGSRRSFLKLAPSVLLMLAAPAYAADLFKMLDPEGESESIQKLKKLTQGTSKIISSTEDIDYKSELAIGESLALEGFNRYGLPVETGALQKYVNMLGKSLARNSIRPDIPYWVVIVKSDLYNAFACPGGIIFISSQLVKSMNDESELAGVVAHEISHVGHKHALQSIKRAKFFEGVGQVTAANMEGEEGEQFIDMIGNLQTILFDKGLDKKMEFEADLSGMECAYKTGYNPAGIIRVLTMLKENEASAEKSGSWFSTHPPLSTRLEKCRKKNSQYPDGDALATVKERFLRYREMIGS